VHDTAQFEFAKKFRENHKVIYEEYLEFERKYNYAPQMDDVFPNGSITNWDRKWPTVTLRCYGLDSKVAQFFPKTMALVNQSEYWLSLVMYSILEPHKYIPRHRGPYRGVFRYQLALEVPTCRPKKDEMYLVVWPNTSSHEFWSPEYVPEGEPTRLGWKVGEDFIFDDTCVHEVRNETNGRRIILFVDMARHDVPWWSRVIHRIFMHIAKLLPAIQHAIDVQDKFLKTKLENYRASRNASTSSDQENNQEQKNNVNSWASFLQGPYQQYPELLPYKVARKLVGTVKVGTNGSIIGKSEEEKST